jgi:putative sterol carrier protein
MTARADSVDPTMTHPFLSDQWIEAVKGIREKYADEVPEITAVIRINQVITDVPFGEGEVRSYLDTSTGSMAMELGELDEADATITTDYLTAKALFVDQDQAVVMQAFMGGKITVQGDMMKLMAMQTAIPTNDASDKISEEIAAITEEIADTPAEIADSPAEIADTPAEIADTPAE